MLGRMSSSPLPTAAAALREFVHLSGALRAQALVDHDPPAVVGCARLGAIEIAVGDDALSFAHGEELPEPPELGDVRQLPPFEVDPATGQVTGTIGGLHHLTDAVGRLASALGGASAAVVEFETTTPGLPLAISARAGEPVVVLIGDEVYDLAD
jgi:hypothetical protein